MTATTLRLRADFRFTIYDQPNGGTRIVLTGAHTGRQFTRECGSNITILVWFAMLRLYLDVANSRAVHPE